SGPARARAAWRVVDFFDWRARGPVAGTRGHRPALQPALLSPPAGAAGPRFRGRGHRLDDVDGQLSPGTPRIEARSGPGPAIRIGPIPVHSEPPGSSGLRLEFPLLPANS